MDKVANTAGTYYAFLKQWTRKAIQPFSFQLLEPTAGEPQCECILGAAQELVQQRHVNILYLDPPYNARSYAHYYHLPETIASAMPRKVHGKAGAPVSRSQRSDFNSTRWVSTALRLLLEEASFDLLVFHYSDDGLIPPREVQQILGDYGTVEEVVMASRGYTIRRQSRQVAHRLYLVEHG